jgi:hypothetical protein
LNDSQENKQYAKLLLLAMCMYMTAYTQNF